MKLSKETRRKTVSLCCSQEIYNALNAACRSANLSRSEYLYRLLRAHFDLPVETAEEDKIEAFFWRQEERNKAHLREIQYWLNKLRKQLEAVAYKYDSVSVSREEFDQLHIAVRRQNLSVSRILSDAQAASNVAAIEPNPNNDIAPLCAKF